MRTGYNFRKPSVCSNEADPCLNADGEKLTQDDFRAQQVNGQGLNGFGLTSFLAQIVCCVIGLIGVGLKNKMISKIAAVLIAILLIGFTATWIGFFAWNGSYYRSTAPSSSTGRSGRTPRAGRGGRGIFGRRQGRGSTSAPHRWTTPTTARCRPAGPRPWAASAGAHRLGPGWSSLWSRWTCPARRTPRTSARTSSPATSRSASSSSSSSRDLVPPVLERHCGVAGGERVGQGPGRDDQQGPGVSWRDDERAGRGAPERSARPRAPRVCSRL